LAQRLTPEAFPAFQMAAKKVDEDPQLIEAWLEEHDFANRAFKQMYKTN